MSIPVESTESLDERFECQRCGIEKPKDNFQRNRWGITGTCLDCRRELRAENPPKAKPKIQNEQQETQNSNDNDNHDTALLMLSDLLDNIGRILIVAANNLQQITKRKN